MVELEFTRQVRDVLLHLYDFAYLQSHPLLRCLVPNDDCGPRDQVRQLRGRIIQAIEDLNPGRNVPFRAEQARAYNILNLRYVEGMSVRELAREMAVSQRQLHRLMRRAEEDLAKVLWALCVPSELGSDAAQPGEDAALLDEAQRLGNDREEVDLYTLCEGAVHAVQALALRRTVQLRLVPARRPVPVRTQPQLARQALVNALSYAVQNAVPGTTVTLALIAGAVTTPEAGRGDASNVPRQDVGSQVRVSISYRHRRDSACTAGTPVARQLVHSLGGDWAAEVGASGICSVTFSLGSQPQGAALVLVIDDNPGVVHLFRRYLAGEGYQLVGACSGEDGLRLARDRQPQVIVLDVMMPGTDGWEVLQLLRNRESTRHIPVIVCSVLEDPELALALGATGFVPKPVDPTQLVTTLRRCLRNRGPVAHSGPPSDT